MVVRLSPEVEVLLARKAETLGVAVETYLEQVVLAAVGADRDGAAATAESPRPRRPISERFEEIRQRATPEVQAALGELPSDFAAEHDHYLYGSPKKYS